MSKMYFVTDTEATGPDFAIHNMYQFATVPVLCDGTVLEGRSFNLAFSTKHHDPERLKLLKREMGFTPEKWAQRSDLVDPFAAMAMFSTFIETSLADHGLTKPMFIADNLAFDWGFINTYFYRYSSKNPFGHSGLNIPCLSIGFYGDRRKWKQLRTEAHTHDALEDTRGNAGAFAKMIQDGLKIQ